VDFCSRRVTSRRRSVRQLVLVDCTNYLLLEVISIITARSEKSAVLGLCIGH
jgi:hypothetical protein